jgi:hypothetical protein
VPVGPWGRGTRGAADDGRGEGRAVKQIQAFRPGDTVIIRNAHTGLFRLTLRLQFDPVFTSIHPYPDGEASTPPSPASVLLERDMSAVRHDAPPAPLYGSVPSDGRHRDMRDVRDVRDARDVARSLLPSPPPPPRP